MSLRGPLPTGRFTLLMLVIWALLIIRIDAPWYAVQESARVWVPAAVRNYETYGIEATDFMVVRDIGPTTPENFTYYTHHPPTIIWVPYAFSKLAGFNALSVRYVFVAAVMITAAAFYVLVRRLYGERMAWWATAFYGLVPMMAYYGRVPNHDIFGMAVVMLYAVVLVNWLQRPNRSRLIALLLLVWLAVWSSWPAVFFIAILGLAAMWLGDRGHRVAVVGFGLLCITAFVLMFAFYQMQWDGSVESLLNAFDWRASNASDSPDSQSFTALEFIITTLLHIGAFVTPGITIMAFWGIRQTYRHSSRTAAVMTLALFLSALAYQLVFRNASYVHDYYKFTFMPVIGITAAATWLYVGRQPRFRRWIRPTLNVLLASSILFSAGWLYFLHQTGNRPAMDNMIEAVNEHSDEQDILMTHLEGRVFLYPLQYYTYRNIEGAATYPEAQARAAESDNRIVFIHCDVPPSLHIKPPQVPDDIQPNVQAGRCGLIFIN